MPITPQNSCKNVVYTLYGEVFYWFQQIIFELVRNGISGISNANVTVRWSIFLTEL